MPESVNEATLNFLDDNGRFIAALRVVAEKVDTLQKLTREEAAISGEEPIQLLENSTYEFALDSQNFLLSESSIITPSKIGGLDLYSGRIAPQSYTGLLPLTLVEKDNPEKIVARAAVEVRSRKLNYREDYRYMLDDIAGHCNDLLMNLRSPSMARLAANSIRDQESISQRFAFISAILRSKEFRDSVNRILKMPHRKYVEEGDEVAIERGVKVGGQAMREIASRVNRRKLPQSHPLYHRMSAKGISEPSVPTKLSVKRNIETVDTAENRFIKHTLNVYSGFLNVIEKKLLNLKSSSINTRLINDVSQLSGELNSILSQDFFKDISPPKNLSLSSPVLQRKAGYREMLQTWLKFNLAANLVWSGGEDVFGAGKKDMDILYEYWLFFQLLKIVGDIFKLPETSIKEIIETQTDGFGLKLKSGKALSFKGQAVFNQRKINIVFSYNRTFATSETRSEEGSWSLQMRPDFTLSIYPADFTMKEAEAQELMVHIHFDAKYRMNKIEEVFGGDDPTPDEENSDRLLGKANRSDLLKMHSYKDAIKRTVGSYVLYPGTENKILKGYHEILPSLGAFAVRPGNTDMAIGAEGVSDFIKETVNHLCNRTTDRERSTFYAYQTYGSEKIAPTILPVPISEKDDFTNERSLPPRDQTVLIVSCIEDNHKSQLIDNNKLALQPPSGLRLNSFLTTAKYLLYLEAQNKWKMFKITDFPLIVDRSDFEKNENNLAPEGTSYLIYDLNAVNEFEGLNWKIEEILKDANQLFSGTYATNLEQLLRFSIT